MCVVCMGVDFYVLLHVKQKITLRKYCETKKNYYSSTGDDDDYSRHLLGQCCLLKVYGFY